MTTWLLYPPFADPTQPYLSLPYLKGSLRAAGLDAIVLDLNVEAAHFLLAGNQVRACAAKIAGRFTALDGRRRLNPLERMEYLALVEGRAAALRFLSGAVEPIRTFQDPEGFYDLSRYREARNLAEDALICTSAAHFPYTFHFNQASHAVLPWGTGLLAKYYRERRSPLDRFYRDLLFSGRLQPGDVIGINLTLLSQLPEAFYIAQLVRDELAGAFVVMGGSCLQQILARAGEPAREWMLGLLDAACPFEGERTLPMLLKALAARGEGALDERLRQVPNLLFREPDGRLHATALRVTDLAQTACPDYCDLDLDRYLAPERTLLFAPARGCYWNRCAFCDYGLSRSRCHDYRQMPADLAARQLATLAQRHGVRNFYLSVDAMAPRFAAELADALIAEGSPIRWSADFRIEKYYSAEVCRRLYASGLRAAALGVESGSDRVLQRMDKGLTVELIRAGGRRLPQAGVATAWMTFSGFPGEALQDALQTVGLIKAEQAHIDLFILGRFGLTGGSRVAAQPARFGLPRIYYCRGDDLRLFPLFDSVPQLSAEEEKLLEAEVDRLSQRYYLDHYPWAGAISTHHSFLYFLRFGRRIFRKLQVKPSRDRRTDALASGGLSCLSAPPAMPVERLRRAHATFMQRFWQAALRAAPDAPAPLDDIFFMKLFRGPAGRKQNRHAKR